MRLGPMLARAIAAVGLALIAAPEAALGAQFTVDSTTDAVDASPGDGVCASAAGECTLRAAIQETNALPGVDEVQLSEGIYTLAIPGEGEDAAATGDLDITDDVTLTGAWVCHGTPGNTPDAETCSSSSIINGGALDRVIHVANNAEVGLSKMEILNGSAVAQATGLYGGGILNEGTLHIFQLVVFENIAEAGGGVWNSGTASIESLYVRHNVAAVFGAGLVNDSGSHLTLNHSFVWGNQVTFGNGGGVTNAGTLTVENSVIGGNSATEFGGGVENYADATATVTTSTISENSAHGGGGIFSHGQGSGGTHLTNVTIAENIGPLASAIMNDGTVTMRNSIAAHNRLSATCSSPVTSLGNNLVNDASCGLSGAGDEQNIDPLIGILYPNGGFTLTHALSPDSPAVDGGQPYCGPTDQRGVATPQDGNGDGIAVCDIGAYELTDQPLPATPTPSPSPTTRTLPDTGGGESSRSAWPVPVVAAALVSAVVLALAAARLRRSG